MSCLCFHLLILLIDIVYVIVVVLSGVVDHHDFSPTLGDISSFVVNGEVRLVTGTTSP
jgi:hypothetical protein